METCRWTVRTERLCAWLLLHALQEGTWVQNNHGKSFTLCHPRVVVRWRWRGWGGRRRQRRQPERGSSWGRQSAAWSRSWLKSRTRCRLCRWEAAGWYPGTGLESYCGDRANYLEMRPYRYNMFRFKVTTPSHQTASGWQIISKSLYSLSIFFNLIFIYIYT